MPGQCLAPKLLYFQIPNVLHFFLALRFPLSGLGESQHSAFSRAGASWNTLPAEAKARAKRDAAAHNQQARINKIDELNVAGQAPTDVPSLWDIGKGSNFALHPDDICSMQHITGEVKRLAAAWEECHSSRWERVHNKTYGSGGTDIHCGPQIVGKFIVRNIARSPNTWYWFRQAAGQSGERKYVMVWPASTGRPYSEKQWQRGPGTEIKRPCHILL